jgi:hypothetical protein
MRKALCPPMSRSLRRLDNRYGAIVVVGKGWSRALTESTRGRRSFAESSSLAVAGSSSLFTTRSARLQKATVRLRCGCIRAPRSSPMRRELRVEDVCTRRRGKRLVGRRARGVQLEGKVEEVGRHQASLGRICISNGGPKIAWTGLLRRLKELFCDWSYGRSRGSGAVPARVMALSPCQTSDG